MLNIEKYKDEILECCKDCESTLEMMQNINEKLRKGKSYNHYVSTFEDLVQWFATEYKEEPKNITILNTGTITFNL